MCCYNGNHNIIIIIIIIEFISDIKIHTCIQCVHRVILFIIVV